MSKEKLDEYLNKTDHDKVSKYFITRRHIFLDKYLEGKQGVSLDVGCGQGFFTEFLLDKGFDSHGIEVREEYLEFAKENGKANYSLGSAESIPFEDNKFDLIILFATLEHIVDRAEALKEINRVLKADGILIVTVPNTWSYFFLRSFATYTIRGMRPWKNVHYQQNYFYWEHLLDNFLRVIDWRPLLSIPFFEPKLISRSRLSKYEYGKRGFAWMSAEPIIICAKREKPINCNNDDTKLGDCAN